MKNAGHYHRQIDEPVTLASTSRTRRRPRPDNLLAGWSTRHAIAEIRQRPNPARRLRTYPRVTKRASGSKFPENASITTTSDTDRHPKSGSSTCKFNGIGIEPGAVHWNTSRRPSDRSAMPTTALIESANGLYKTECIRTTIFHAGPYKTVADVEFATAAWVDWYNNSRLHSSIGLIPPTEFETIYYAALNPMEAARNLG